MIAHPLPCEVCGGILWDKGLYWECDFCGAKEEREEPLMEPRY
jgi:hypothetical protein